MRILLAISAVLFMNCSFSTELPTLQETSSESGYVVVVQIQSVSHSVAPQKYLDQTQQRHQSAVALVRKTIKGDLSEGDMIYIDGVRYAEPKNDKPIALVPLYKGECLLFLDKYEDKNRFFIGSRFGVVCNERDQGPTYWMKEELKKGNLRVSWEKFVQFVESEVRGSKWGHPLGQEFFTK